MLRFALATTLLAVRFSFIASAQTYPAYRWDVQVDGSGLDSFAGLGVDAQGNTYIAGSTYSPNFPVQNAVQSQSMSAGLYSISGTGPAFTRLGPIGASAVFVDPVNPNVLYVILSGPGNENLVKSTDGGATFSQISGLSGASSLAIDPANDQILYVAGSGVAGSGILKSTDGGATWTAMNNGLVDGNNEIDMIGVWIDPSMPEVVLANGPGTGSPPTGQNGLMRSADGGANWQSIETWQSATTNAPLEPVSLYFDTVNPGTIYAAINGLPFKSTDHGQTFAALTPAPSSVGGFSSIVSDPNTPERLLASPGIYESDDDGVTWTLETVVQFVRLARPQTVPQILLCGHHQRWLAIVVERAAPDQIRAVLHQLDAEPRHQPLQAHFSF
jgi:hypothetical protein